MTIASLKELQAETQPRQWTGHCHIEGTAEAQRKTRAVKVLDDATRAALPALIACAEALQEYEAHDLNEDGSHWSKRGYVAKRDCAGCRFEAKRDAALKALEEIDA